MKYVEALSYLNEQGRFGIKPGLERIKLLLERLENPQAGIAFVHVTGTNGKGSVSSMLTSIFQAAGLRTGKFISPHLERWNERINIDGQDVSDEDFSSAIGKVKEVADTIEVEDLLPTQFEILTAAAFLLFKKAKLDLVVLEVGMGGLFDSTNVITPECSIITNIGIDHTQYFGETLEAIAREKAGIIKQGIPVVTGAESVALNILIDKAVPLKADLHSFRIDFTAINLGGDVTHQRFMFRKGEFVANFTVGLGGDHQVANAALAVMASRLLSEKHPEITVEAMQKGLLEVKWPGRLELLGENPTVILDGAHNFNGAQALRMALDKFYPGQDVCFIIGIMEDKDVESVINVLVRDTDFLIAVSADDSLRAAKPENIVKFSKAKSLMINNLAGAIDKANEIAGKEGLICIAGSLYLAGLVKGIWTK